MKPIRADKVKPERVEWLWADRIPRGMMTIVGGRPDQAKGLLMAHIAAAVSNMKIRMPSGRLRWGRVLYSAIEDSHGLMTAPRLQAAGARMNQVDLWRFQIPSMQHELEAHLIERPVDLLVMDPMAAHLSRGVSRHSDNIRQVLNPLAELIEETRTGVVIVEHVLKRVSKNGHPLGAIGGSGSGLPAAARMAYLFGTDPSDLDRRVLASVKSNIRDTPKAMAFEVDAMEMDDVGDVPYLILADDSLDFDPMRLVVTESGGGKIGRPPDKRAAACEWLTNYLYAVWWNGLPAIDNKPAVAPGPAPAGRVMEDAQQFGMASKTLRRAAQDMEIVRNPPGGGRNCDWQLPDEVIEMLDKAHGRTAAVQVDTSNIDDELAALLGDDDA